MKGLGTQAHGSVTPDRVKALALDFLDDVERESGKPVVTSNQAAMWGTLRRLGDKRAVPGAGRLFRDA
jgi:maleate cis-trans isomerase